MQLTAELETGAAQDAVEQFFFDYTEWRRTHLPDDDVELLSLKATEYAQTLRQAPADMTLQSPRLW